MKKTATYLPARSFLLESACWHPDNQAASKDRFTGGVTGYDQLEMFSPTSIIPRNWALMSAGHSDLSNKRPKNEYWTRNRDRQRTRLITDSGGFQIAKGTWKVQLNPPSPEFIELRKNIFQWQERMSDWAVSLDVPSMIFKFPDAMKATGVYTYEDALQVMKANLEYYLTESSGSTGWLNALQGRTFEECDLCYSLVKEYNRPHAGRDYCRGWALGALQAYSAEAIIRRFIEIKWDGLLETTEWIHFLGRSKLYHTILYSEFANCFPEIEMTYDSSGPFVTAARGSIYSGWSLDGVWPLKSIDIPFGQGHIGSDRPSTDLLPEGSHFSECFKRLRVGDLVADNGRDSALDGLSYVYLMAHNLEVLDQAQKSAIDAWQKGQRPEQFDSEHLLSDILKDIFHNTRLKTDAIKKIDYYAPFIKALTNHKMSTTDTFNRLFDTV